VADPQSQQSQYADLATPSAVGAASPYADLAQPAPAAAANPHADLAEPNAPTSPYADLSKPAAAAAPAQRTLTPFEKDLGEQDVLLPEEVEEAAQHHGANSTLTHLLSPFITATRTSDQSAGPGGAAAVGSDMASGFASNAGRFSEGLLAGVPQGIVNRVLDHWTPETRAALDDLKMTADDRRSAGREHIKTAQELAAGLLLPISKVGVAGQAAMGGAIGASQAWSSAKAEDSAGTTAIRMLEYAGFGAAGAVILHQAAKTPALSAALVGGAAAGGYAVSKKGEGGSGTLLGAAAGSVVAAITATVLTRNTGAAAELGAKMVSSSTRELPQIQEWVMKHLTSEEAQSAVKEGQTRIKAILGRSAPVEAAPSAAVTAEVTKAAQTGELAAELPSLAEKPQDAAKAVAKAASADDTVEFASYLKDPAGFSQMTKEPKALSIEEAHEFLQGQKMPESEILRQYSLFKDVKAVQSAAVDYLRRNNLINVSEGFMLPQAMARTSGMFGIFSDRNPGSLIQTAHREISMGSTRARTQVANAISTIRDHMIDTQKAGLSSMSVDTLQNLEKGGTGGLDSKSMQLVKQWDVLFDTAREKANAQFGEELIPKAGSQVYFPRMAVDSVSIAARVRSTLASLEQATGLQIKGQRVTPELWEHLEGLEGEEAAHWNRLKGGLSWLSKAEEGVTDPDTFQRLLVQGQEIGGVQSLLSQNTVKGPAGVMLSRSMEHEASVPDFLRETDPNRMYPSWMRQIQQQIHLAPAIANMNAEVAKLRAVGDIAAATYAETFLKRVVNGQGRGPSSWIPKAMAKATGALMTASENAKAAGNLEKAGTLQSVAQNLDLIQVATGALYSNLLGWRPSSIYKAAGASVTSTLPHLSQGGTDWAIAVQADALQKSLSTISGGWKDITGKTSDLMQIMHDRGYLGRHFTSEATDSYMSNVVRGSANRAARSFIEKYSNMMMAPLQWAEASSRLIAMHAGETVAREAFNGGANAARLAEAVGGDMKLQIARARATGDLPGLIKWMQDYTVHKTLHMYAPEEMSQAGHYMGKVVTAFSTWSTATATDVVRDYLRQGAVGGTASTVRKVLAPIAALMVLDRALQGNMQSDQAKQTLKTVTGAGGFAGAAPGADILKIGSPEENPYYAMFKNLLKAGADKTKWVKSLDQDAGNLVPGMGMVRFLDETLPGLAGRKPDHAGQTYPERAVKELKQGAGLAKSVYDAATQARQGDKP